MISLEETKYCLESNFIIDLLRGKENAVTLYNQIKDESLTVAAIASVTLFEILRGRETNQKKIIQFEKLREKLVVLSFGEVEAEEASRIEKEIHDNGDTIHAVDLLIGATAKTNNTILITNDSDYQKINGLEILNY